MKFLYFITLLPKIKSDSISVLRDILHEDRYETFSSQDQDIRDQDHITGAEHFQ